jgi:hypothetical protein
MGALQLAKYDDNLQLISCRLASCMILPSVAHTAKSGILFVTTLSSLSGQQEVKLHFEKQLALNAALVMSWPP